MDRWMHFLTAPSVRFLPCFQVLHCNALACALKLDCHISGSFHNAAAFSQISLTILILVSPHIVLQVMQASLCMENGSAREDWNLTKELWPAQLGLPCRWDCVWASDLRSVCEATDSSIVFIRQLCTSNKITPATIFVWVWNLTCYGLQESRATWEVYCYCLESQFAGQ